MKTRFRKMLHRLVSTENGVVELRLAVGHREVAERQLAGRSLNGEDLRHVRVGHDARHEEEGEKGAEEGSHRPGG